MNDVKINISKRNVFKLYVQNQQTITTFFKRTVKIWNQKQNKKKQKIKNTNKTQIKKCIHTEVSDDLEGLSSPGELCADGCDDGMGVGQSTRMVMPQSSSSSSSRITDKRFCSSSVFGSFLAALRFFFL